MWSRVQLVGKIRYNILGMRRLQLELWSSRVPLNFIYRCFCRPWSMDIFYYWQKLETNLKNGEVGYFGSKNAKLVELAGRLPKRIWVFKTPKGMKGSIQLVRSLLVSEEPRVASTPSSRTSSITTRSRPSPSFTPIPTRRSESLKCRATSSTAFKLRSARTSRATLDFKHSNQRSFGVWSRWWQNGERYRCSSG